MYWDATRHTGGQAVVELEVDLARDGKAVGADAHNWEADAPLHFCDG